MRENYIILFDWMINDLGLSGNKLNLYALIYGFSRVEGCYFTGSLSYITKTLGVNKTTAIRHLKELTDEGMIVREEQVINGVVFPKYKAISNATGGGKIQPGVVAKCNRGGCKMQPNNTNDNINNNIDNIPPLSPKQKKNKIEYAEGVSLTLEEYDRLVSEFGESSTQAAIEYLSLYKQEKGYKTKSDNLTIRRWVMDAVNKRKPEKENKPDRWQEAYNYIHSKYDKQFDGNN